MWPLLEIIYWYTRLWLIGIDELDHSLFMYWFVWFYIENKVFPPHPLNSVCRLGVLTCYLDPVDLGSFLQDSVGSLALWQQLAQCMSKGFISDSGRVNTTCSVNLLETTDILIFFSLCAQLLSPKLCLTNWADLCVMNSCPLGWYQLFRRWTSAAWLLQTCLPSLDCYLS